MEKQGSEVSKVSALHVGHTMAHLVITYNNLYWCFSIYGRLSSSLLKIDSWVTQICLYSNHQRVVSCSLSLDRFRLGENIGGRKSNKLIEAVELLERKRSATQTIKNGPLAGT